MPKKKTSKKKPSKKAQTQDVPNDTSVELIKGVVVSISGTGTDKIVDLLAGKKNVNEFDISEKMGLTINQTRNVLYKLSDEGLVGFIRKKDKKNGGWYTYFWTLDTGRAFENLHASLKKRIDEINKEINLRKHGRIYFCEICGIEYNEENALLNSFSCPECGSVLALKEDEETIRRLNNELDKLNSDLERVSLEMDKVHKKEDQVMVKKQKAEERKKKAEREKKRKENAELKKTLKKSSKDEKQKSTRKKPVKKVKKSTKKNKPKKSTKKTKKTSRATRK